MKFLKQREHFVNDNIILTTQEIINYFYDVINNINIENKTKNFQQENIEHISKEIEEFISRRMDFFKKNPKYYATDIIKLLHYALVSLIDEMLITKNWWGRLLWRADTLERRIFSSLSSGDLFFEIPIEQCSCKP